MEILVNIFFGEWHQSGFCIPLLAQSRHRGPGSEVALQSCGSTLVTLHCRSFLGTLSFRNPNVRFGILDAKYEPGPEFAGNVQSPFWEIRAGRALWIITLNS